MTTFRKKPVEVEAMRWDGGGAAATPIIDWILAGAGTARYVDFDDGERLHIDTLEGTMHASPGDYVIKGVQGEFYPCKPDIFEQTYDRV